MKNNLEYYKVFYYVVILGSFTKAAEKLCISQPAVSQTIKSLEKNLNISLFVRTSKGITLTSEGELLFSYVKKGYEYLSLGEISLQKMLNLEQGELHIGASDMTLQFYLLPYLEQFHEKYPHIKVKVTNGPTPETLQYLYKGTIDFGVVSSPFPSKQKIHITKVKKINDIFIAGNKFNYLKNQKLSYQELTELPIICLEQNTSTRQYIDYYLSQNSIILKPEFELATSDIIVQFALRNLGIGCVVEDFARPYLQKKELFSLTFKKQIPSRNYCVVIEEKKPISNAAKQLLKLMIPSLILY